MYNGYKNPEMCFNNQTHFDNQPGFPIGDAVSKQTSAPPWDYTPQPYNSIPNYSGETHLNHRQVPVIHNQNIPQFDRKENALNITGHDNNNPLVHYSTNNNTHQSIVRPTALVNCHSNCNACCNHSNRVSHHWNVTSDGRYLDNSSSLPKDLPRYPSISSYSHEESKFIGDFASSLNKLSRFSREKANPNRPGFVPPAVEQDHVSPIVNSSAKALNTSSAVSSDSIPVKKDSCATCQGGCQSSCRFFKHQSSVQFPSQDNIHQDQHSLSTTQENVVRYMGHTTLNNVTSNQWNMSNRPQTGMWLPNGHHPPFWVQPDSVRMNASGSVSFWGDRNEEISSNISQPMRSSFHGMARYKSHMMNQKVVRLHEAEQKKIQDIARYHEVQRPRYQDPSSNKSEENYQDPGRYHDAQRKAHSVQFHDLPKQSSQTLNYSEAMNKEFAGHSIDGLAPSSTKLQGISRNTITSSELGQGVAAPYPVEQDGTRRYTDISNAHPARSMATNFNTSSQANINFTTGIAQPPSRFSSHVTYTQSKITKTNNYMQCIYPPIETSEKNTNFVPVGSKMAYANSEIVPSNRNQYTSVVKESGSNFEFVTNSVDKNSDVIKYCDSKNSDPGPNYSTLQPCNKMSDSAVLGKTMQVVDCPGLVKTKPYFCNQTLQGSNNFYSDIPRYVQTKVSHSYENLNGSKAYHMFGENNMPANFHSLQQTYQMNPIPAQNSSSAISSNVSILPPDKASSDLEDSSYVNEHNPNIYNRSPFEDGTGRYIKKRRSRLKGISKKSQNLHSNKNNQTLRQYLANWDEECDDVTTNPKLPDVVPSNNVEPVLVLDYRSLGNDGLSSLQADVGIGRPADSGLIQMTYQAIDDMNTENKQSLQNIPEECEHIDGNIGGASLPTQKTSKHVEPTLEGSKEKEPLTNTSLSQDCQHLEENPSEVTLSPIEDYSKTNSIISPCVPERDLTLNEQEVLEHSANNRVEERKGNIVFHQSAKESLSTTEEHTVHNFETLFNEHSSDSAKTNFATGTPSSSVLECPSIGTEDQSPSYSGNQSVLSNQNTDKIPVSDSLLQKSLSTSKNINISNEAIDALLKDCAEFSESGLLKLHSQEVETQCNNVDIDENIDDILQTVNHQDNTSTSSQNTIFTPINSENKDVVVSENSLTTRTSAIVSSFVKELEKNKEQTQIQPKRIDFKSLEKNTILTPCHNTFVDSEICEIPSKQNKLEIKPFSKIVSKQILTPEEETTSPCHTPKEQFITNVEKQDKEAEVSTSKTSQSSFKNESSIENILGDSTISYSNKENLSSTIGKEVDTPVVEVCGKDKPTIHSIDLIKNSSPDVIVTGFEDKDKINSSDGSLVLQNNKIATKSSAIVQIQLPDDGDDDDDDDDDDDNYSCSQCTLSEIDNTNVLSEIKLLSTCGEGYQQPLVNHEMKTKLSAKTNQKVANFCSEVTGAMQITGNLSAKIADCIVQDESRSKSVNETHKELHLTNESESSEHACRIEKYPQGSLIDRSNSIKKVETHMPQQFIHEKNIEKLCVNEVMNEVVRKSIDSCVKEIETSKENNFQSKTIMNTRNIIHLEASQPIAKDLTDTDILNSSIHNNNIKSHFAYKKKPDSHLIGNTVTSKSKNLKSVRIIRSKSAAKPRLLEASRPSSHTCEDSSIPKSEQYLDSKIISNFKINSLQTVDNLAKGVPSKKKRPIHNLTLSNRKTSFVGLFDTHINVSPNSKAQRVCNNDEPINYIDLDMEVESENESPHEENSTNITVDKIPHLNIRKLDDNGSKNLNHYKTLAKVNSTHNTSNSSNFDLLKSLEEAVVPINHSSNSVESCTIVDKNDRINSISVLNLNDDESSINQNDQIHLNKFSGSKNNLKKSSNDKTSCFIEESTLNSRNPNTIFRENHNETNENSKVDKDIDIEKSFLPIIEEPDSIERNMEEIHKETNFENHKINTPNNYSTKIVLENDSGTTIDNFKTNENQPKSKDEVQKNVSNSLYQKFGNDKHLNIITTETSKISSIGILIQQLDDNDTVKSSTSCIGIDNSGQKPLVKDKEMYVSVNENVNTLYNVCENSCSAKNITFDQNTFLESNSDLRGIVGRSLKTNYPDIKIVGNTDLPLTIPLETTQNDPDIKKVEITELPLTLPLETTQNEIVMSNENVQIISSVGQCKHIDETIEMENVELKEHSFSESISTNLSQRSNIGEQDQHIDKKEASNRSTVKFVSSNTHACIISRKVGQAVENIVCKLKKKASQVVANQAIGVEECTSEKTQLKDQNTTSIEEVIPNLETKNITSKIKEVSIFKPTEKNKQSNLSVITDDVADICVHSNELHYSETKNSSQETTSNEPNTNIDIHNSNKINSGRYMVEELCDDTQKLNSLGNSSKTNNDSVFIKSASDRNAIVSSQRKEYISTIRHGVEDNILLNGEHKPSDQCIVELSIIPNLKTVDSIISSVDHPTSSLISVAFQERIEERHSKEEGANSRNNIVKEKSINIKSTNSPADCSINTSLNSHSRVTNTYMVVNHTKPGRSIDSESNLVDSSNSSEEKSPSILNEIENDSHSNKYNSNNVYKNTVECVSLNTKLDNSADINNVKTYNKLTMQSHSQLVGDKNISEPESETMERGNIRLFSEEILNFDSKGALNLKMKKENETSTPDIYFECQPSSVNKDATSVIMELTSTDTNKCNETSICDQGTLETSNSKELQANIIQNLSHKQTLATNSEEKSITLLESPVINEVSHMCVNQHSHIVHCCNTEQHSLKCCEDTDLETLANKHISSHTASITACEEPLDNVSVTNVLDISTNGTVSSINTEAIPQENDLTITRTCSKDKFVIDLPGTDENKTKESTLHSICSHKKFKCDSPKLLRIQADTHTSVFESKAMEVQENGFENNFDNNTNSANVTELSLQYEGTEFVEQSEETHIWPVVVESNMPILDSTQIVIVTEDDEDNTGQIGIENTTPCHETNAVAVPISPEMPCLEPFTLPENVVAICNESDFEMPILNVSENASLVVSDGNRMPQLETTMSSIISTSENNDNSSETLPQSGEHERHLEYDATSFQESIIEPYKSVPHNYTHGSDSLSKPFIFERHCHEESLECSLISNEMQCSLTKTPEIIPTDSVSNWPYLEEEVPSELQVSDSESTVPLPKYFHGIIDSNGILTAPPLSPIPSSDEETLPRQTNFKMMLSSAYRKTNNEKGKPLNFFKCRKSLKSEHFAVNPHNGLKCQLSWNRIFALSKIDECKKLKTKKIKQKRDVSKGWPYYGKSPMRWTRIKRKETDEYKSHLDTTDQIIRTLSKEEDHPDLLPGTSNVKVCLTPKSHHEREGKTWCVVDPSGSGESSHCSFVEENNNDLVTASQNTKQDELYNNQVPIVLVKKLVLKRGADGKIANECEHLPKFTHSSEDDDGIKQTDAANAIGRKILINTEERNTTPCSNVLKNADIELNSMSLDIEAIEKNLPSTLAKRLEQGRSNKITSTNSPRMCDSSAGCSLSGAESCDGSEKHVPRVIIKRTGSGTNYKSFLRESSYSTNFWQPVVRIQRNKDLDNLSRSLVKSDCPKKVVHLNRLRLVIRRQSSFEREKIMKNNVHQVAFVTNIDPTSMNEIENVPSVKKREESLEKKEIFTYAVENNAKKNKLTSHRQRNELNTRVHDTEIRYLKHNKPQSYGQLCFVREKERLKCPTIPERNKVRAHNEIKKKHSEINCISQSAQSHSYDGMKDQCNVEKNERKERRYSECSHNILGYHIAKVSRKRISEGGIDINEKGKNSNAFADNIPYYKKRFAMGSDYEEESTKDSTKDNQTGSKESVENIQSSLLVQDSMSTETLIHSQISRSHRKDGHSHSKVTNSRGNSTTILSEKHLVLKEGSKVNKECEIKQLKKRSSNSSRVPETCQVCGSHYKDKAEKIEHVKEHLYHCQQCHIAFNSKGEFVRHRSSRHPRTKEQHHCLLCQRTFPTLQRHQLHLSGHLHRHLETAQRRTIHTLFRLFTGNDCPALTPLSEEEASGVSWFPAEGGAIHFYHQAPPLQIAVQDYIWKRRDMGGSADDSNIHEPSHDAGTSTR